MLYKKTRLEDTFGVNMLVVADGRPEVLGLREILERHIDFRFELAQRKYRTLLEREQEKREIQEGLIKACDVIDLIIEILRGSQNQKQAKECLISGKTEGIRFRRAASEKAARSLRFTEKQATAILEMRLYRLIGLEIQALMKEHEATMKNIAEYEDILNNYKSMARVIIKDLDNLKKEFAVPRKTSIENAQAAVYEEKGPEEMEVAFLMDRFGYCRTMDTGTYERNKEAADAESRYVIRCLNTDRICVFTDKGRQHLIKVMDVPFGKFRDKGTPIDNLCNYSSEEERFVYVQCMEKVRESVLLFATSMGMLKKVEGAEFDVSKRTIAATKLTEGDALVSVMCMEENQGLVLQTRNGYFLKLDPAEIPVKKKAAAGVRGIRLTAGDQVEHVWYPDGIKDMTAVYQEKEVSLDRLRLGKRDGRGAKPRQ